MFGLSIKGWDGAGGGPAGMEREKQVSQNDEFCIKNEELCVSKSRDFVIKMMNFAPLTAGERTEMVQIWPTAKGKNHDLCTKYDEFYTKNDELLHQKGHFKPKESPQQPQPEERDQRA